MIMLMHSFKNIIERRKKTKLAIFSCIFSTALGIVLCAGCQSAIQPLLNEFNNIVKKSTAQITPVAQNSSDKTKKLPSTEAVFEVINTNLPKLKAAYQIHSQRKVQPQKNLDMNISVKLIDSVYFHVNDHTFIKGRAFQPWDKRDQHFAIIGKNIDEKNQNASSIVIDDQEYHILGVIDEKKQILTFESNNDSVFLLSSLEERLQSPIGPFHIKLESENFTMQMQSLEQLLQLYHPHIQWHHVINNLWIEQLKSSFITYTTMIFAIIVIINILTGFNLSNHLYFSILERKEELAIRMTLGASHKQIKSMLLSEAFYITFVGAVLGAMVSQIILFVLSLITSAPFVFMPIAICIGMLLCITVGMISAYLPAKSTKNISPLDIIRHD